MSAQKIYLSCTSSGGFLSSQVETVGDKYMTVSGLPETCDNHAKCIARLALDLMDVAQNVMMGSAPVVSGSLCCGWDVLEDTFFENGVPN